MKRGSTIFLRAAIIALGLAVIAVCIFALPAGIRAEEADGYRPILIGMYFTALPFFFALYQAMKLLQYIDTGKIFTGVATGALWYIKYCAFIISALFAAGMPYIYHVANEDDAPGIVALGLVIVGASFVIAIATGVFQRLLQTVIDIKSENDLTV